MQQVVLVSDLGPANDGKIGPNGLGVNELDTLIKDSAAPDAHCHPTRQFVCVDGRPLAEGEEVPAAPVGYADPKTAGSLVVTLASAFIMITDKPNPLSKTTANCTAAIIGAGFKSVMHEACGAGINQREVLVRNSENVEIVVPIVWKLAEQTGLSAMTHTTDGQSVPLVNEADAAELIIQGGSNAKKDDLIVCSQ